MLDRRELTRAEIVDELGQLANRQTLHRPRSEPLRELAQIALVRRDRIVRQMTLRPGIIQKRRDHSLTAGRRGSGNGGLGGARGGEPSFGFGQRFGARGMRCIRVCSGFAFAGHASYMIYRSIFGCAGWRKIIARSVSEGFIVILLSPSLTLRATKEARLDMYLKLHVQYLFQNRFGRSLTLPHSNSCLTRLENVASATLLDRLKTILTP